MRRLLKWGVLAGLAILAVFLLYGFYIYGQIRDWAARDDVHPAEAIVVLGAAQYNGRPSPVLKARLDHAFDLYRKGYARTIITTGSYGPDPNFSEAQVSTKYLVQHGVDSSNIITDQGGGSTYDSIEATSSILKAKGWNTALVVSDGFHLYRVKRMFTDKGIIAYTSPAPNSPIEVESSQRFWHSLREVVLFSAYRWMNL
jgi:vancomycin permeability regulator SanA